MPDIDTDAERERPALQRLWEWFTREPAYMFDEEHFARLGPKPVSEIDRLRAENRRLLEANEMLRAGHIEAWLDRTEEAKAEGGE